MNASSQTDSLSGSVVVVTGAARGLGASLARQLTAKGARVALLGLEPTQLAEVSASCPGSAWWEVDVTDGPGLTEIAAKVVAHFGGVDVLVANAGVATGGSLLASDPATYDRVIEINLLGSIRTVRAFLPSIVERRGYVLQVASLAAILPGPLMGAYCASKSGVEAFAHALRGEVRRHGVDVGVAYLSWTDTDMVRGGDEIAALGQMRAKAPWPFRKTYPVEPTVAALVAGITRRSAHVYGQPWVRVMPWFRGVFPALIARTPRRELSAAEDLLIAGGTEASRLVGAGGAAAAAATTTRSQAD
jgi:NAD(P)-dependent dehydrogenase (short-subunit alcohol dehydrogenase family)